MRWRIWRGEDQWIAWPMWTRWVAEYEGRMPSYIGPHGGKWFSTWREAMDYVDGWMPYE